VTRSDGNIQMGVVSQIERKQKVSSAQSLRNSDLEIDKN
jgi:hypothetical protein